MISAVPIALIVFAGLGVAAMSVVAIPRAVKDAEKMSALQIGLTVLGGVFFLAFGIVWLSDPAAYHASDSLQGDRMLVLFQSYCALLVDIVAVFATPIGVAFIAAGIAAGVARVRRPGRKREGEFE